MKNTQELFDGSIDCYFITSQENRFYFSGIKTSFGGLILTKNQKFYITDFRYKYAAEESLPDWELKFIKTSELYNTVKNILQDLRVKTVAFEDKFITHSDYLELTGVLTGFELVPGSDKIETCRMVKTEEEIQLIAEAQRITEKALEATLERLKPKMSERDVCAELIYNMYLNGADGLSFEPIVAMGVNTSKPHHSYSDYRLEKDDLITIDIGCKYKGYCSDMTRTFTLGEPDKKLEEIYNIVKKAQEYALSSIKAGMTGHEADSFAREYITANGYGEEFGHGLGHSLGLFVHENPRLGVGSNIVLKENMVATIEPGIYVQGLGGARIEDLIVIKNDGIENLTHFTKNLKI
ncbi:MAG: aminopeptidase P family protein [Clostridiales bacterium]|nr:aminopeptidase P family protein [Clostridiales bacterium]